MPRASSQPSKLAKSGFGVQEGVYKITEAAYEMVQHSNKQGELSTPHFSLTASLQKLDDQFGADPNVDEQDHEWPIAWGKKNEDGSFDLSKMIFRPGQAENGDDTEPEDLGIKIGTKGNMLFTEDASKMPFSDSDYGMLVTSLEKAGFNPALLDQSYAPNLVGLVVKFKTVDKPLARNAKTGDKPRTALVVERYFPEQSGKTSKKKGKSSEPATTEKASEHASGKANGSTGTGDDQAGKLFTQALDILSKDKEGETVSVAEFRRSIANILMNDLKVDVQNSKPVVSAMKKAEFVSKYGMGTITVEGDQVEFA